MVEHNRECKQDLPDLHQLDPAQFFDIFSTVSSCTSSDIPVYLKYVTKGTVLQLPLPHFFDRLLWNQVSP